MKQHPLNRIVNWTMDWVKGARAVWPSLAVIVLSLGIVPAQAQYKASLHGTVADQTGAVIPGAKLTLVNTETNETKTTVSDGHGDYTFTALPPGKFRLLSEKQGFKKKEIAEFLFRSKPTATTSRWKLAMRNRR